jgi:hypothetical protein
MRISAGRQKVNLNFTMNLGVECRAVKPATESTRGQAKCRISRASITMNGIKASSEDPIPKKKKSQGNLLFGRAVSFPPQGVFPSKSREAQRKVREELRKIRDEAVVELSYGQELRAPTVAGLDPALASSCATIGGPILDLLKDSEAVLALFVSDATRLLPQEPVGVGAVWHVELPNPQMPDLSMPTAVQFESVTTRGEDKIATLQTTAFMTAKGPQTLKTAMAGGTGTIKDISMELSGTIVLNLTQQTEESNKSVWTGKYTVLQGGNSAKANLTLSMTIKRRYQAVDGLQTADAP